MSSNFQSPQTIRWAATAGLTLGGPGFAVQNSPYEQIPVNLPFDQLCVFAQSYETSDPLVHLPLYAIAQLGLVPRPEPMASGASAYTTPLPDPVIHYPLGMIGTDHAGYASFDLGVLRSDVTIQAFQRAVREILQAQPPTGVSVGGSPGFSLPSGNDFLLAQQSHKPATPAIGLRHLWVFPFADPYLFVDALREGDIGPQFISLRIELDEGRLYGRHLDRPMVSMQNPSILDWHLSPGSFSLSGVVLVGQDNCELLVPSNLSTQQFRFRQVTRTGRFMSEDSTSFGAGHVIEYSTEWFSIGHSLGQLLYTLPLAPGEVVKIAVVDWSRSDSASRSEDTGLSESLVHDQLRDRTLTESVHAVLDEWQRGGSIMGGVAGSIGAGAATGGLVGAGLGLTAALGGGYSTSSGTRDLTAQTTQRIADAFHQSSTAMRELRSTVIVQSAQAEKSDVQTRVVANYNHSHALTLLYYEVLRHYRVVTRVPSVRPALLVDYSGFWNPFNTFSDVIPYRAILEAALLDHRLMPCFDALERYYALSNDTPLDVPDPGDTRLVAFSMAFRTGGQTSPCNVNGWLRNQLNDSSSETPLAAVNGEEPKPEAKTGGDTDTGALADKGDFDRADFTVNGQAIPKGGSVPWKEAGFIQFHFEPLGPELDKQHVGLMAIDVSAIDEFGANHPGLGHVDVNRTFTANTDSSQRFVLVPLAHPPKKPDPLDARMRLTEAERACVDRLFTHLQVNAQHYNRALWLNEEPNVRAKRFAGMTLGGTPLPDVIENRALEVLGDFVAFPISAGQEQLVAGLFEMDLSQDVQVQDAFIEQLLTLPTRGVFAEAKLGNCNASELIDNDRFWDWQKSPIPILPPDIADASAASRAQQPSGLTPTAFPQSLLNIVTPGSLPDPTGLADALKVLGTPGIFRDMSGIQQVGALLGKLSDGATSLAGQALKGQQQKELMDAIRNAPELSPAQKSDLIGKLLTGQVDKQVTPPAPAPGGTPGGGGTGGTGAGGTGATSGGTAGGGPGDLGGGSTPPPSPKPEPAPIPKKKPPLPDPAPSAPGLIFSLTFNVPVLGTTAEGVATTVDIYPVGAPPVTPEGEQIPDIYVPGITPIPPSLLKPKEYHYTNLPFTGGRAVNIRPESATAPGNIHIVVEYNLLTFDNNDVVALWSQEDIANTRLNKAQSTFRYDTSVKYNPPAQGSIVGLNVTPKTAPITVTGESGSEFSQDWGNKVGGEVKIINVDGHWDHKSGTTTKSTRTVTITYLTGGLDVEEDGKKLA
jgi:hypothetical protein